MGDLGRLKEEYRDLVARLERGTMGLPEAEDERSEAGRRAVRRADGQLPLHQRRRRVHRAPRLRARDRQDRGARAPRARPGERPRPDRRQREEPAHLRLQLLRLLLRAAPGGLALGAARGEPERLRPPPPHPPAPLSTPGGWRGGKSHEMCGVLALRAGLPRGRDRDGPGPLGRKPEGVARAPDRRGALHRLRRLRGRLPQGRARDGARGAGASRPLEHRRAGHPDGPRAEPARRAAVRRGRRARRAVPPRRGGRDREAPARPGPARDGAGPLAVREGRARAVREPRLAGLDLAWTWTWTWTWPGRAVAVAVIVAVRVS